MTEIAVLGGLFTVLCAIAVGARSVGVPYPVLLVLGGLAVAFVPGVPAVEPDPQLLLLGLLPPLLYPAALRLRTDQLRDNAVPIGVLAVGLVPISALAVGAVTHAIVPSIGWPVALLLGAIVSPPDPVAATSVAGRLGLPARLRVVLEGEGLLNDAVALVLYRLGLVAVVDRLSASTAAVEVLVAVIGGIAVGRAAALLAEALLARVHEAPVENVMSLLIPFAAFIGAEVIHGSGVLAVVVAGVSMARARADTFTALGRLQGDAMWDVIVFCAEGIAFLLIGIELRQAVLSEETPALAATVATAAAVATTAVVVRLVLVAPLARTRRLWRGDPAEGWQGAGFVAWAGMRGLVSMAAVLALPRTIDGEPFPGRELLVVVTFTVIATTLILQGSTLPTAARLLGLARESGEEPSTAQLQVRMSLAQAALSRLDEEVAAGRVSGPESDQLRSHQAARVEAIAGLLEHGDADRAGRLLDTQRRLVAAERAELERLWRDGAISRSVYDAERRSVDAEWARLDET